MWTTDDGNYEIDDEELGHGLGARVFQARRWKGDIVAIKVAHEDPDSLRRLRREIEVQGLYEGPHIMPVLDMASAPDPGWYTMPLAIGNLADLRHTLTDTDLAQLLRDLAGGLREPHANGEVHRDLKPANVLAIPDETFPAGRRWVIGDWGFVRRGPATDTTTITKLGGGTYGYIAPECQTDAHAATPAADIYSLGRLTAWFLTGSTPQQGLALSPRDEHATWRRLVRRSTANDLADRCPDLDTFLALLDEVEDPGTPRFDLEVSELVDQLLQREDEVTLRRLAGLAVDHPEYDVYVDDVARLTPSLIRSWGHIDPTGLAQAATNMAALFTGGSFGNRNFDQLNWPLRFLREAAGALLQVGHAADAEATLEAFFEEAVDCDRWAEQHETTRWLSGISESHADLVARVIRRTPGAGRRYDPSSGTARAIRQVVGV